MSEARERPRRAGARAPSAQRRRLPGARPSMLDRARFVWARRLEDWRRDLHRLAPIGLFAALSCLTVILFWLWASGTAQAALRAADAAFARLLVASGLSVQEITSTPLTNLSKEQILEALGAARGQSILHVELEAARARIEALAWVESAIVSRRLPDKIHLALVERRPFALWERPGERTVLIDRAGRIITAEGLGAFAHLPRVAGHGAAEHAHELIEVLDRAPALRSRVAVAQRVSSRRWTLHLDNGVAVYLPDQGIEEAIRELLELDEHKRILGGARPVIDMRLPDRRGFPPGGAGGDLRRRDAIDRGVEL